MRKLIPQFDINARVRLRDGIDPTFYGGFSRTGNEGWIRHRKWDKYGYPHVLIEWDRNHWSWNGTANGWSWESHFEPADDQATPPAAEPCLEDLSDTTPPTIKPIDGNAVSKVIDEFVAGIAKLMNDDPS